MKSSVSKCRSCGAAILWVKTKLGKNMPIDWDINFVDDELFSMPAGHVAHWSTCKDPGQFRKPKK